MFKSKKIQTVSLLIVILMLLVGSYAVFAQDATEEAPPNEAQPFLGLAIEANDEGVLITDVLPGGAADEAGIEVGDIVTAIDGEGVTAETAADIIAGYNVGDTITLTVLRDGEEQEIEATLGARQEAVIVEEIPLPAARPFLGVRVSDGDDGVIIAEVVEDSPAAEAGLQANDVLVSVNGEAVENAENVVEIIQALQPSDTITLEISRNGEVQEIEATLGEAPRAELPNPGDFDIEMMPGMGDAIIYEPREMRWFVLGLQEDSTLYEAGLRPGDVITAVDGGQYAPETLGDYLNGLEGDNPTVTITVERAGSEEAIAAVPVDALAPLTQSLIQSMPGIPLDIPGRGGVFPGNGRLGVGFVPLNAEEAESRGLDVTEGSLIISVDEDSPAAEAGLQVDDIVTAVNGEPVDEERTLRDRLYAYEPGDTVTLTVLRDGETLEIEATLGEQQMGGGMFTVPAIPGEMFQIPVPPAPPPAVNL